MANLHSEFGAFHDKVALSSSKKASLRTSRDAIRDRIRKHFIEVLKVDPPKFHAQGSFTMVTTMNPLDGEFDIDDGVYLQHLDPHDSSKWPTPETVHGWIIDAIDDHTDEKPIDKRTCVRVQYAGQYHVDLPSYAKLNGDYMLAVKGDTGWHRSDPKAITDWFKKRVKQNGEQFRRIVRYLKAWTDYQSGKRGKMPNGLIMTVLASDCFCADVRDDVSLANTAAAIKRAVTPVFCVRNPADTSEEITRRLTDEQKSRFQAAITDLAADGAAAIAEKSRKKASKLWQGQLGDRFPLIDEEGSEDEDRKKEDANRLAAFFVSTNPPKPWAFQ
jgi:hypothetical protein